MSRLEGTAARSIHRSVVTRDQRHILILWFFPYNLKMHHMQMTCSRSQSVLFSLSIYRDIRTSPPPPPSPPLLLPPSVLCYKYPVHTAGPATKAVISAVIRNLITVDASASRLSLQLWNVTKSSFHAAPRFPRPPRATAGTTSDAGNLETVVLFELGSSRSRTVQSGVLVHKTLSKPSR